MGNGGYTGTGTGTFTGTFTGQPWAERATFKSKPIHLVRQSSSSPQPEDIFSNRKHQS